MNKEDFKNVEDMIKDIEDVSYEKNWLLKRTNKPGVHFS